MKLEQVALVGMSEGANAGVAKYVRAIPPVSPKLDIVAMATAARLPEEYQLVGRSIEAEAAD